MTCQSATSTRTPYRTKNKAAVYCCGLSMKLDLAVTKSRSVSGWFALITRTSLNEAQSNRG